MVKAAALLVLLVIIALPIVASQFLPWWGSLIVLVVEFIALATLGPRLIAFGIKRYLLGLFKRKSSVLEGAIAQVHAVSLAATPDNAKEDPDHPLRYLEVEFTLTPRERASVMQYYDPSEFLLVPFDSVVSMNQDPTAEDLASGVVQVRMIDASGEETQDVEKLTGPARLKVTFACPAHFTGRAKLRYYFEDFGDLTLPQVPA